MAAPANDTIVMLAGYYKEGDKPPVPYECVTASNNADDGGYWIKPNGVSGAGR